ncbi:D-alanyl-D-alanine carboxypeptidase, partial [Photobacterium sp. MCCC 1A19761]
QILYQVDGETVAQAPLVALESVSEGGFFSRLWDTIHLFFVGLFS